MFTYCLLQPLVEIEQRQCQTSTDVKIQDVSRRKEPVQPPRGAQALELIYLGQG